ncbi:MULTISPECIES: CBS domain-containing protein [Halolamina]|uniref:Zinc metalloprotease n=1 Tax=Halolamina pelagica TaxID=699431 RepID=A0A1I5RP63_9EURY|nr:MULTISPECIES: CBS domain-containing protein [Halolamina]NHX35278.1 CBS domain-containing protein [Halolamina sp. R1-12]SFP60273.1 Zn-dependent protease (includes SpoIVFB) [Halolamina pelagica]
MRGIRLGSIFGIPIKLNVTFLLILPLLAYLIGSDVGTLVDQVLNPAFGAGIEAAALTGGSTPFVLGAVAAVGLFTCVLLHELGHSVVAMYYGYEIDSITLWLLGGVAQFTEMPEDWKIELQVAIAGPIVSVALGALSYAGFTLLAGGGQPVITFVLGYLMLANVVLAAFNMLPGFPMDGGRVLRALLARTRTHARATQLAAEVGKGFALLLALFALFTGLNLYLLALAFFIYMGAAGEAQQTVLKAAFRGVTVADVMTGDGLHTVAPEDSVADLIQRMFRERHTGYPVVDRGELVGMVTLGDAQSVDDVERDAMRVDDVMTTDVYTVTPETDAMDAFQTMQQNNVGRLPVVDADGELCGIVSRTDLMTAFDIIQQSGAASGESLGPNLSPFGR